MGKGSTIFSYETVKEVIKQISPYMDDFLYVIDIKKDLYYISEKALERFDIEKNEFSNVLDTHKKFVYGDDIDILLTDLAELLSGKKTEHNIRYRWIGIDGKPVWINCRGCVFLDESGKPVVMAGCINEIGKKPKADNVSGLLESTAIMDVLECFPISCPNGYILRVGIDDFKDINERFGIEYGDYILHGVAKCITDSLQSGQEAYRVVADEYLIVDFIGGQEIGATRLYREICNRVEKFVEKNGYDAVFTVSAGLIACKDIKESSYNEILKLSQYSLSEAKHRGKNQIYLFDEDDYKKFLRKRRILHELREAVANDWAGFDLYFQPIMDSDSGKLYAAESLLRFKDSTGEMIPPVEFIPILEESGLIIPVGKWILKKAVAMCKECQKYVEDFKVTVNLSYIQILKSSILTDIFNSLSGCELKPDSLVIELTESGYLENTPSIRRVWENMKELGIMIAIDDFGTGYSNLQSISNMTPDIVKLDRGFTVKALKNAYENQLMTNIIQLVHSIDLKICIEGVENDEELKRMQELNPDYIQGYFYGRPCPREEFLNNFIYEKNK